jgi:acyl carrier protein
MDSKDVSENTSVDTVEAWDSLRHMMMISALEEAFAIEFDDTEVIELVDYKSLCEAVQAKLA